MCEFTSYDDCVQETLPSLYPIIYLFFPSDFRILKINVLILMKMARTYIVAKMIMVRLCEDSYRN